MAETAVEEGTGGEVDCTHRAHTAVSITELRPHTEACLAVCWRVRHTAFTPQSVRLRCGCGADTVFCFGANHTRADCCVNEALCEIRQQH